MSRADPIRGVDHVQLPIPLAGAAAARGFYERVLGLREVRSPALDRPGVLRFDLGWQRLDLAEALYGGAAPQAHLALRVADLATLRRRLLAAEIAFDDAPLDDRDRLYVEDPFRNRLELIDATPDEEPADVSRLRLAI